MRRLQISYDQVYSIKYFGTAMVPLWKKSYGNFTGLLKNAPYDDVIKVSTILIPRQSEYESTTKPYF